MMPTTLKPLTYGVMHFLVAIAVAYALTGSWAIALGIGMVEPMVQTIAYILHEKAWAGQTRKILRPRSVLSL